MKKTTLSLITASLLFNQAFANETLEDINIVSANKTTQSLNDVTSDVNVITAQEIEERGFLTVVEALNSLPGISFTSNGGLGKSTSLYLRGMDTQRTLVLIDGTRYQDPSNTSGASLQHLMISDIERIEVIKGAQSGVWGADAAAGVINIITKSAQMGTHASANVEFGSFSTKTYGALVSHKTEKYNISLSANKVTSDGFSAQAPRGEDLDKYEDDGYDNLTVNAKMGIKLTDDIELSLEHTYIDGTTEYDSYGNPDDTAPESDFTTKLTKIALTYTIDNHFIHLKHEISDFQRDELGIIPSPFYAQVTQFNGKVTNTELTDKISYRKNDFLLVGFNYQESDADYVAVQTNTTTGNQSYTNKGIFIVNTNHVFDNTVLTESLRYDQYDAFDNKVTGKIGIKHTLNSSLQLSANYGTAYNAPNIIQMLNPWAGSNLNLQPETVKSYDLSIDYFGLKFTYFNQKIDDMIAWYDPDGWGGTPGIFKNYTGTSKINGFEISYQRELLENILFSANYTKLTTAEDKDGNELARRPKENLKVAVDYYGIDNLHLGVNGEYVGTRYDQNGQQGTQTGKYTIFNITADYQLTNNIQVYGKIENLGDKYYQTVDGYATSPRAFYIGVRGKI